MATRKPPLRFPTPPRRLVEPLSFTVDNHGKSTFTVETKFHVYPTMPEPVVVTKKPRR